MLLGWEKGGGGGAFIRDGATNGGNTIFHEKPSQQEVEKTKYVPFLCNFSFKKKRIIIKVCRVRKVQKMKPMYPHHVEVMTELIKIINNVIIIIIIIIVAIVVALLFHIIIFNLKSLISLSVAATFLHCFFFQDQD